MYMCSSFNTPVLLLCLLFLILTGVEKVCTGFETEQETPIDSMTTEEAAKYLAVSK